MATLLIAPDADAFLSELEATPTRVELLGRLNTALDSLESDPTDIRHRRRRFSNIGCWAIAVNAEHTEWLILWDDGGGGAVVVRAIVPAP